MLTVKALDTFEYEGRKVAGDEFPVIPSHASQLIRKGLVVQITPKGKEIRPPRPLQAVGAPSSASPAVPVSPQTTSIELPSGETPRKRKRRAVEA